MKSVSGEKKALHHEPDGEPRALTFKNQSSLIHGQS